MGWKDEDENGICGSVQVKVNPRILVCGDRNWTDEEAIRNTIKILNPSTIITGGALGADSIAAKVGRELNIPVMVFMAEWDKYGRAAGPIRNKRMLDEGKPDYVVSFHDDLSKSKGTVNMIEQAKKAGVCHVHNIHNPFEGADDSN